MVGVGTRTFLSVVPELPQPERSHAHRSSERSVFAPLPQLGRRRWQLRTFASAKQGGRHKKRIKQYKCVWMPHRFARLHAPEGIAEGLTEPLK